VIQDLGSTNGTFINGTRISGMQVLTPGDTVAFGEGIVLVYESVMDNNATILSTKAPPATIQSPAPVPGLTPMPAPMPAPTPVRMSAPPAAPVYSAPAPKPAPAPVYSGQVPAGPAATQQEVVPAKKKFPTWILIVIIVLVLICVCGAFFEAIDYFSLWCKVLPFLVPLLGGTCV
jgi:hypothetical protein